MNFTTLLGLIPTIIRIVDFMKRAFTQGVSINSVGTVFENEDVKSVFSILGGLLFPKVRPELQAAAAISVSILMLHDLLIKP